MTSAQSPDGGPRGAPRRWHPWIKDAVWRLDFEPTAAGLGAARPRNIIDTSRPKITVCYWFLKSNLTAEIHMPRRQSFIDGERIRKARTLRCVDPIHQELATALATIPQLRFIKLFPGRLTASNRLSVDGKQNPVVAVGAEGITGVELLIDADHRVVQFYAITAAEKGCGRKMVEATLSATPADWFLAVLMDWSGGFWERMARDYPRLQMC